ncbi:MAG: response regulator, partial [Proteobacteria bacterium]
LFSSNLLGIVFWNVHERITDANRSFLDLLGYRAAELNGMALAQLTAPEFFLQDSQQREILSVQEHTAPVEKELVKRDGTRIPVVAGSGWISKSRGEGFSFVLDRTELKRAGEERARLQGRADSEREASRLKSQFLAKMSHEIRTPLHAILGFSEFLNDSNLTAEQRAHVQSLRHAGENLLHLTNDLLDLSRIEAKAVRIVLSPLNIGVLVREVISMVRAAHAGAVPINLHATDEMPMVMGDRVRITQIFTNILSNAAKFTLAGQIDIYLSSKNVESGLLELTFRVKDSGVGIPAEAIPRLFAPFVQAEGTGSKPDEGSGLGLWISRHLAELMGGAVELTSEQGVGTSVTVRLSLNRAEERVLESVTAAKPSKRFSGARVLVAEDNLMNQVIAQTLLSRAGCSVTIAENGEETLRKLGLATFDLLLLDCQMPDIDGYQVARAIRAREKMNGAHPIPILAVTADAMGESKLRCEEAGMSDYVSKPYDHDLFLAKIEELLRPREGKKIILSFDAKALRDLWQVDGTGALREELLGIFSAHTPKRLSHLEACVLGGDRNGILQELHTLRACFGSVGLSGAAVECLGLELSLNAREEAESLRANCLEPLHLAYEQGWRELQAWREAYPPTLNDAAGARESAGLNWEAGT